MRYIQSSDDPPKDIVDGEEYVRLNHDGGIEENSGEAYVRDAKAKADAQASEAHAKEVQAKEAQAKAHAQIKKLVILLSSLTVLGFVFKKQKKNSDAAKSRKVSELSARLSALKSEMDRETENYESWSKKQPEAWKNIKTDLVDSYLASEKGQILNKWDFGNSEMEMRMGFVRKEQAFLPPSARPADEQWQAALKPKVEPEAELVKQRQTKIRDILLSRLVPNYETQQYDMDDLDVKFIDLDLEKTDAILEDPMSDEEVNKLMAATTELLKTMESPLLSDDELTALLKKIETDQLDYLRSTIATHSPVFESRLKKIRKKYENQVAYLQTKIEGELRVLEARHPEKFT
jgi:hypothetical protein